MAIPVVSWNILLDCDGTVDEAFGRHREQSAVPPAGWVDVESWYLERLVPLRVDADLEYLTEPSVRNTMRYLWLTARFVVGLGHVEARAVGALEIP